MKIHSVIDRNMVPDYKFHQFFLIDDLLEVELLRKRREYFSSRRYIKNQIVALEQNYLESETPIFLESQSKVSNLLYSS